MKKPRISKTALKRKIPSWIWTIFRLMLLIGISYVVLYPLFVKISLAVMPREDLLDVTVKWIPTRLTFDNFKVAARAMNYLPSLAKTMLICGVVSILQVISCTMAGYAFARFRFPGNKIIFAIVILTLVIPPQTYLITLYTQFKFLKMLETSMPFIALAATGMGIKCGLYIYIMRQVFRGIPKEIEEAARVDGANTSTIFLRVMLPNATATVVVVFLLSFVWQYNDNFFTGLFSPGLKLLSYQLGRLQFVITEYLGSWNTINDSYTSLLINTGSLLVIAPLIIMYIFFQRSFVESAERSGIVG